MRKNIYVSLLFFMGCFARWILAEELSILLDERHPERKIERAKQALYDAYVESERSLDEIIDLIRNADEWI